MADSMMSRLGRWMRALGIDVEIWEGERNFFEIALAALQVRSLIVPHWLCTFTQCALCRIVSRRVWLFLLRRAYTVAPSTLLHKVIALCVNWLVGSTDLDHSRSRTRDVERYSGVDVVSMLWTRPSHLPTDIHIDRHTLCGLLYVRVVRRLFLLMRLALQTHDDDVFCCRPYL